MMRNLILIGITYGVTTWYWTVYREQQSWQDKEAWLAKRRAA